ncbi:hypothetical protein DSM106972_014560 [Dulcicalothrix desertica PCC 7102]|uniref:Filamentous haemagglutinin FhaB/tRNA nuclease CdiA-like TPS domain-containing protein n=2 Tax=Dulcicalothrix desertica TaxID=32056 RepID=A0A433VQ99_9CYAN|nr:hypothetical protein DSM106972_014560 [Dulcicalothrix desertica PCC 7102]TWH40155.1 filamentous hemagglutinin family protein [Dulcicalothrix desertica PCC 7102]
MQWGITCCLFCLETPKSVFAQSSNIIPDTTLGVESSIVIPFDTLGLPIDTINGGAVRGVNLLHSFEEFNVSEGRSAYFFSSSADIQNILARVTGRNASSILGTLGTLENINGAIYRSSANLFLMNPNGIIFGENARLDLAGSFVATTANAVEFGNEGVFSTSTPQVPQLLTVNPSALLLNQIPAPIINKSRAANSVISSFVEGLRVESKNLVLLGGDINFDGGVVNAFGGKVEVAGLAGVSKVGLDVNGNNIDLKFPENIRYSNISLDNNASIINGGNAGSEIKILGNQVTLNNGSQIVGVTTGNQTGKPVSIQASKLNISNESSVVASTQGSGSSGDILINAETLNIQNTAILSNLSSNGGNTGKIKIEANDVNLDNIAVIGILSLVTASNIDKTSGGNIEIDAKSINIQNSSGINNSSFLGQGVPGNVTLTTDSINLSNSIISATSLSTASGGNIVIDTQNLNINSGGQINNSSVDPVNPDFINYVQRAIVSFDPTLQERVLGVFQSWVNSDANVSNFGEGNSGNIDIRAEKSIVLSGTSPTGALNTISTETFGRGKAGNLTLTTSSLTITDGGISTQTSGAGDGGTLNVSAAKINLAGVRNRNGEIFRSGLLTSTTSNGAAGNAIINAGDLSISDGAEIAASTSGTGKAGDIIINASGVELNRNVRILASSTGSGTAGNINLTTTGRIRATDSNIQTSSLNSSGGKIDIAAERILLFGDSNIQTNVFTGAGGGGDITLTANYIIALNDSDILSFARDGKGGDIRFNTLGFFSSPLYRPNQATNAIQALNTNNRVDVNASGAVSGTVSGIRDISFLQNSLGELPQNLVDTNALLANSCIARRNNEENGTFFVTGSGGLPERPGDAPISDFSISNTAATTGAVSTWKIGDSIVEPSGVYRLPNGKRILTKC